MDGTGYWNSGRHRSDHRREGRSAVRRRPAEVSTMYDVILLVEQELTEPDAQRVVELHEQLPEQVKYHLVIPCEDAAAKVETSLATLAGTELYGMAATRYPAATADRQPDLAKVQRE